MAFKLAEAFVELRLDDEKLRAGLLGLNSLLQELDRSFHSLLARSGEVHQRLTQALASDATGGALPRGVSRLLPGLTQPESPGSPMARPGVPEGELELPGDEHRSSPEVERAEVGDGASGAILHKLDDLHAALLRNTGPVAPMIATDGSALVGDLGRDAATRDGAWATAEATELEPQPATASGEPTFDLGADRLGHRPLGPTARDAAPDSDATAGLASWQRLLNSLDGWMEPARESGPTWDAPPADAELPFEQFAPTPAGSGGTMPGGGFSPFRESLPPLDPAARPRDDSTGAATLETIDAYLAQTRTVRPALPSLPESLFAAGSELAEPDAARDDSFDAMLAAFDRLTGERAAVESRDDEWQRLLKQVDETHAAVQRLESRDTTALFA